jgi:L-ectoine synthase
MGFSLHKTLVPKGEPQHWHYRNHLEACYCISGHGVLVDLATGKKHHVWPGTVYLLDQYDDHTFQALEDVELISIFNPPITGRETHDESGSYPLGE